MRLEIYFDDILFDTQPARIETHDWEAKEMIKRYEGRLNADKWDVYIVIPSKGDEDVPKDKLLKGYKCHCKGCTLKPIKTEYNKTIKIWVGYCKFHYKNQNMNNLEFALKVWRDNKAALIFYNHHCLINSTGNVTGGGFIRLEDFGEENIKKEFNPSELACEILYEYYQHLEALKKLLK